jgi:hypothetical protein
MHILGYRKRIVKHRKCHEQVQHINGTYYCPKCQKITKHVYIVEIFVPLTLREHLEILKETFKKTENTNFANEKELLKELKNLITKRGLHIRGNFTVEDVLNWYTKNDFLKPISLENEKFYTLSQQSN